MDWCVEVTPQRAQERSDQLQREWQATASETDSDPAVLLAFDTDAAGQQAVINAMLMLVDASPTAKNFLRAQLEGEPYEEAIRFLSNEELFIEYQNNKASEIAHGDDTDEDGRAWYEMMRSHREAAMLLITERAKEASDYHHSSRNNVAGRFNNEHTITEVLAMFDIQAVPGRNIQCPAHEDSSPSCTVFNHDHRIYCHAAHCILNGRGRGEDAYGLYRVLSETKN